MSIDRNYCKLEIARLAGLVGYPRTDGGVSSLLDAFSEFSTQRQTAQFVSDWLRTERRAPQPADVYAASRAVTPGKPTPAIRCTLCYDTGQTVAEFLVTWRAGKRYCERLTAEQAAAFWQKNRESEARGGGSILAVGKQMIYEGPVKCDCQREERMPPAPEERERYA